MSTELSLLLSSIAGGTGAMLSFWAGWRARDQQVLPRGSYEPRSPGAPSSGMRRVYFDFPHLMAECGGPCWEAQSSRACDCGALWRDVPDGPLFTEGRTIRGNRSGGPTTPKPEIVPNPQPPRRRSNPFVSEFQQQINDALGLDGYQPRRRQGTPNPPPRNP